MFSGLGALSRSNPIFFFIDSARRFCVLSLYMARIYDTAKSTLALRQRKRFLLSQIQIRPDSLRASLVERFARCGKANCHCHREKGSTHSFVRFVLISSAIVLHTCAYAAQNDNDPGVNFIYSTNAILTICTLPLTAGGVWPGGGWNEKRRGHCLSERLHQFFFAHCPPEPRAMDNDRVSARRFFPLSRVQERAFLPAGRSG